LTPTEGFNSRFSCLVAFLNQATMFTPVSSPPLSPILTPVTALPLLFREMDVGPLNQWYDFPMDRVASPAVISLRSVFVDHGGEDSLDRWSERSVYVDHHGDHCVRGVFPRPVAPRTIHLVDGAFPIVIQHMMANHATDCKLTLDSSDLAIEYRFPADNGVIIPARTVVAQLK
jgi:hypothetical protein